MKIPGTRVLITLALTWPLLAGAATLDEIQQRVAAGDYQYALQDVEELIRAEPSNPDARFLRGVIIAQMGDTDRAIAIFNSLTHEFPDLAEPYNNLAVLYAARNDYVKARDALEQAVKLQPDYDTAHENLGDVHAKLAALAYERAVSTGSGNIRARSKSDILNDMLDQRVPREQPLKSAFSADEPAPVAELVQAQPATDDLPAVYEPKSAPPPKQATPAPTSKPAPAAAAAGSAATPTESQCYEVGPVKKPSDVNRLREWFRQRGASVSSREQAVKNIIYKVYIPPLPSYADARAKVRALRKLGEKDMFILPSGDLKNGISVGVFSSEASVSRRQQQLLRHNESTQVQVLDKPVRQVWIMARKQNGALSASAFKNAFKTLQLQPRSCNQPG